MSAPFMPAEGADGAWREWFYRLLNAREDAATLAEARDWLRAELAAVDVALAPEQPETLALHPIQTEMAAPPVDQSPSPVAIAFHAPLGLLEGAWLQSLAVARNSPQQATARLFAAYLTLLGKDEADSPAFAYRGWLNRHGLALSAVTAWHFAQDARIGLPALRWACVQLALGLNAADHFAAALGYTLAYAHSGSAWRLPALVPPRRHAVLQAAAEQAAQALQLFLDAGGDWQTVRRGYALHQASEAEYLPALHCAATIEPTLAGQVAALFRRKLRFARGYHAQVQLGGRGLEDWFAAEPFDAAGFLNAFADSPYATGASGQRPFDRLTAFGGPMFGVFDHDEIGLVTAWLDGWQQSPTQNPFSGVEPNSVGRASARPKLPEGRSASPKWPEGHPTSAKRLTQRQLFHRLLQPQTDANTLAAARRRVEHTLARARRTAARRFFAYTPAAFARHIEHIHQQEITKHRPFQPPPRLNREEYVWGIRQFAPAVLVDGCWLQHQGEAARQDNRLHRLLYRIYAEELGAGHTEWNHPKLYRDLLDDLGIALPATDTAAFTEHPEFLDAAFDLPSYLLAIAQFPKRYLAETLGLNLAIELSGLGAGYLRLIEELRYCGINPQIVSLHLSIDTLAGGHAAIAAEAIQIYLDDMRTADGEPAVDTAWRRIGAGYYSLNAATTGFKWALAWAFCKRFMPARLRS